MATADNPGAARPAPDRCTRRDFLRGGTLAVAAAGLGGCATNPVTGRQQLMLMSPEDEVRMDRAYSPQQFSADYGALRDPALNAYLSEVGQRLARQTHRPQMPYSFRAVNASYLNAYAFPGGSIAVTRGLLLELEDEAELAALLGHELGHVNARHTADRMTKSALTGLMVTGLAAAAGRKDESYRDLALGLGGIGSGLLLAHYSRADERQADALGMEYAVKAGYSPGGMADLLSALMRESREQPSAIELMFATHPMSEERRQTALTAARGQYAAAAGLPDGRERYQAATARLRTLRPAIEAIRAGDRARAERNPEQAAERYGAALAAAPDDYEALLKLAKCRLAAGQSAEALRLAERARAAYPEEPQSLHVRGLARLQCNRFDSALSDFQEYERRLAGNPNTIFFQGRALEGMDRRGEAAAQYRRFLNAGGEGEYADYARRRLAEWTPPALRGT